VCVFLKVFSPEIVYTASFGGDAKPLIPGYWLVLAFNDHLISHHGGFLYRGKIGMNEPHIDEFAVVYIILQEAKNFL